jgi:5'(3')-deoxyribonucleotidase
VTDAGTLAQARLMPGVYEALHELSQDFDLYLYSHRRPELTDAATRLLQRLGIYDCFVECHWRWGSKREFCESIGALALVDDSPHNLRELEGSRVWAIAYHQEYNADVDCLRARDWVEVVGLCYALHICEQTPYRKEAV